MDKIKVLYIDDDVSNIDTYGRFLSDEFDMISFKTLPSNLDDYVTFIKDNNIQAVIVDDYFEKEGLPFSGLDVILKIIEAKLNVYILFFIIDKKAYTIDVNRILYRGDFLQEFNSIVKEINQHVKK